MNNNYVVYHLHSDLSLLDSCTKYKDYIDKAVEYGMKAIGFSEHGNIYNWIEKKIYCDEKGIKYLHGCEVYLTEKLYEMVQEKNKNGEAETKKQKIRDNYHTVLIAKNMDGVRELNLLVGQATDEEHMYYKPRITFDEFLNISDNVIKISACMASPLNKLNENNPYYEQLLNKYDYYEIQYHIDRKGDQISYNKKLYELSQKYHKPLITGTDTHSLNQYKAECRYKFKKAKKMVYDDEDSYDLTFKSYDELVEKFQEQNSLEMNIILEAINNTNKMAELIEDVILDPTVKYPKLSENDEKLFEERIYEKCAEKIKQGIIPKDKKYLERIQEEIRVFKKLNMCSFMLFMSEMCVWCRENNIPTGFCRGSVGGSMIAYILDIIDLDPIQWNTIFSRFCNEDREEVGDIDLDFSPTQRELVYNYIINRFGEDKSAYILAIGTISDKGTIDDLGRAMEYPLNEVANIKKIYEQDSERAREMYPDLFYYFDGLIGTSVSQSMHPAGIIASPVTLPDNYGCFWNKEGKRILFINMEEVHDGAGLVKYDILGLKNIEIIKDTCSLLNIQYPKSYEIDWNDEEVWKHITDSPVGIFQFEGNYAYDLLKRYQPRKINDLSLINASLRPSGASYRDRLIAKEFNHNPSKLIDELLKDNNGFLVFQEDVIAFLQQICGLSGSEADNVRRAIGRKQLDRLEKAMPSILEGYCSKSDKSREIAENEAKEFLEIISNASNYMFGYNHSTGYSMIGYLCGYFRYHYPLEFITAYLNNANNDDDTITGSQLANQLNIKISSPKFRYSKGTYHPDKKTNSIYKGIGSIKYCNETIGEEMYVLRDKKYQNFLEVLLDLFEKTSIDSRQLEILIKLGFFSEFGKSKKLLSIVNLYNKLYTKKQFKKADLNEESIKLIRSFSEKETEKMFTKVDTDALVHYLIDKVSNEELPLKEIFIAELEYIGYLSYTNEAYKDNIMIVTNIKINNWGTPFVTLYKLNNGVSVTLKVDKKYFNEKPLTEYDIVAINNIEEKNKRKKNNEGKWIISDEKELILNNYSRVISTEV